MKNVKKISSMLIALVLALMIPLSAFATSAPIENGTYTPIGADSKATLNVATGNANDTLSAYKVVDINYAVATNNLTYAFTTTFTAFQAASTDNTYKNLTVDQYLELTEDELKPLLGAFSAYIKTNTVTATATATTGTDGAAVFANMAMGQYIILGSGNSTGALIYETLTAEVAPEIQDVDGKQTYVLCNAYNVTMKTSDASSEKTITGNVNDGSVSIGDTVTFKISATVPTYPEGATNKTFYLGDTPSIGLTLKETPFTVKGYTDAQDTTGVELGTSAYKVVWGDNTFNCFFNFDEIAQYAKVEIAYEAVINEHAASGSPIDNSLKFVYSNDPFNGNTYDPDSGEEPPVGPGYTVITGTQENKVTVHTYSFIVNKYDADNEATKLANATFEIYTDQACTEANKVGTITTDSNGYAAMEGLKLGTYYLKETIAPAGYKLLPEPVKVELTEQNATAAVTTTQTVNYTSDVDKALYPTQAINEQGQKLYLTADGTVTTTATGNNPAYVESITTTVDDVTAGDGKALIVDVANTMGGSLPTTGGMGTTIFTVAGVLLIVGAAVALIVKRRVSAA